MNLIAFEDDLVIENFNKFRDISQDIVKSNARIKSNNVENIFAAAVYALARGYKKNTVDSHFVETHLQNLLNAYDDFIDSIEPYQPKQTMPGHKFYHIPSNGSYWVMDKIMVRDALIGKKDN